MGPITKIGFLKGAALATFGTAALGAGSAFAAPSACVTGTLGSFATGTPCTFGTYTFTLNSISSATLNPSTLQFFAAGNGFGIANSDITGTESIDFTLTTTTAPRFFTSASLNTGLGANTISVVSPLFSLTSPSTFNFPGTSTSSITGATYSLASNVGEGFNTGFTVTSDVPVPLPILGAGLAFGFTRKLRKRAKSIA